MSRTNLAVQRIASAAEGLITALGARVIATNTGTISDGNVTGVVFLGAESEAVSIGGCSALTSFHAPRLAHAAATLAVTGNSSLATIALPTLLSIDGVTANFAANALTSFTAPALATLAAGAALSLNDNELLAVSLPALATFGTGSTLDLSANALTDFALPALATLGDNVTLNLLNNALSTTAVNALLAAWRNVHVVSGAAGGTVNLSGGIGIDSNAVPGKSVLSVAVNSAGSGYAYGDAVIPDSGLFLGVVDAVDETGAILSVAVSENGVNAYGAAPTLTVLSDGGGAGATVTATMGNSDAAILAGRGVTVTTN